MDIASSRKGQKLLENITSQAVNVKGAVFKKLFRQEKNRRQALAAGYVVPDSSRCVQCGICSYSCPIEIDVRRHAWEGIPVQDSHCLTCGECVARCPRGVLRFEQTPLFNPDALDERKE